MNSSKYHILSGGGERLKKGPSKGCLKKITADSVDITLFRKPIISNNSVCRDHHESQ
jgi:hypothetical protein